MTHLNWLKFVVLRHYRNMGLRVLLYALLSFVATLISPVVNPLIQGQIRTDIDFESVAPVLSILATSMLAVSTFSLNIMVTAHRAAADSATPRMHRILLEDTTTQSVLAVFIGAFVYSLVSLILYRLDFYPADAALLVMAITGLVVTAVILSLLRWINHLATLGSLQDSLDKARTRAASVLQAQMRSPRLGASALTRDTVLPARTQPLRAPQTGYLQLIDVDLLQERLPDQASCYLFASPGMHVLEGEVIGQVSGSVDKEALSRLANAMTFGDARTHEQDAEFGLLVLSEIASKALSPGINDSGTAIEALMILKSLLWDCAKPDAKAKPSGAPNVFLRFPDPCDLMEAALSPIVRDGAGKLEVALALRQSLAALATSPDGDLSKAACAMAEEVALYAKEAGLPERDLARLRAVTVEALTGLPG